MTKPTIWFLTRSGHIFILIYYRHDGLYLRCLNQVQHFCQNCIFTSCQSVCFIAANWFPFTNTSAHFQEIQEAKSAYEDDSNEALEEHFPSFVKFPNLLKMLQRSKDKSRVQALQAETNKPLRYWQACLKTELENEINDRTLSFLIGVGDLFVPFCEFLHQPF